MEGLLDSIKKKIPTVETHHGEWLHFAYPWPKLVALELEPDTSAPEKHVERLEPLRSRSDSALTHRVGKRSASLIKLPPAPRVIPLRRRLPLPRPPWTGSDPSAEPG